MVISSETDSQSKHPASVHCSMAMRAAIRMTFLRDFWRSRRLVAEVRDLTPWHRGAWHFTPSWFNVASTIVAALWTLEACR